MPQDGSNNYQYPPGTPGVPDQTIESEAYNTFLDDLVNNDLNAPRPVHRGGTGANNAAEARDNLDTERAAAQVTNYDAHVFEAGSFYSLAEATGGPVAATAVSGICHFINDQHITLEARPYTGAGVKWVRQKTAGVWGAWASQEVALDSRYVNVTGDTMTGTLTFSAPAETNSNLVLNSPPGQSNNIYGQTAGLNRWRMVFGTAEVEAGSNVGSNFALESYADDGVTQIGTPLFINRANGIMTMYGGSPTIILDKTGSGANCSIQGNTAQRPRWRMDLGNGTAETGSHAGSNFSLHAFGDDQQFLGTSLQIERSSLNAQFGGQARVTIAPADTSDLTNKAYVDAQATALNGAILGRVAKAGDTMSGNLAIQTPGASLTLRKAGSGEISSIVGMTNGVVRTRIDLTDAAPESGDSNGSDFKVYVFNDGVTGATGYLHLVRAQGNFTHSGATFLTTNNAYKPGGGPWSDSSDARIKNVLGDYTRGLDAILQLQPVRFTFKGNDTVEPPSETFVVDGEVKTKRSVTPAPYQNSAHALVAGTREFSGLIAQAVEGVMPEMVRLREGYIDGQPVSDLRDLDTTPLLFALVNAVKELAARVEQLEGTGAAR